MHRSGNLAAPPFAFAFLSAVVNIRSDTVLLTAGFFCKTLRITRETMNSGMAANAPSFPDPQYDFRMPHVKTVSKPESSLTKEPLIIGMFENVIFQEWEQFDDELRWLFKSTSELSDDDRNAPQKPLETAFNQINELGSKRKRNSDPQDWKRFAYYCEQQGRQQLVENRLEGSSAEISQSLGSEDPRVFYDTSTSCNLINQNAMESIRIHLNMLFTDSLYRNVSRSFRLLGSLRNRSRSPVSDSSLVEIVNGLEAAPPICCYELKGPRLNFATPAAMYCEEYNLRRTRGGSQSISYEQGDSHNRISSIRGQCDHEVSAEAICHYLNYVFGDRRHYYKNNARHVSQRIMMPFAQTVVQALTTSTGCAFLFTHELGVAFEIVTVDDDGRLVIKVSRVFCCNLQKGSLAAAVALGSYAIKKHRVGGKVETIKKVVKTLVRYFDARNDAKTQNAPLPQTRVPRAPQSSENSRNNFCGAAHDTTSATHSFETCVRSFPKQRKAVEEDVFSEGSDVTQEKNKEDELLEMLDVGRELFVTEGASGMVMAMQVNGEKLATKHWNGATSEGLNSLRREIEVYRYIEDHAPSLLGSSVPSLWLAVDRIHSDCQEGDLLLVTKYVGENIFLGDAGELCLGSERYGRRVSRRITSEIQKAALKSLNDLHKAGIMHGDLSFDNMRVSGDKEEPGETWKVWWIDFGLAKTDLKQGSRELVEEKEECRQLFAPWLGYTL